MFTMFIILNLDDSFQTFSDQLWPALAFLQLQKNKDDKYYYDSFSVNHKYLGKILWQPI